MVTFSRGCGFVAKSLEDVRVSFGIEKCAGSAFQEENTLRGLLSHSWRGWKTKLGRSSDGSNAHPLLQATLVWALSEMPAYQPLQRIRRLLVKVDYSRIADDMGI